MFFRILRKSPPEILDIILAQESRKFRKGWVQSLSSDLAWLSQAECFSRHTLQNISDWVDLFVSDPKSVSSQARAFCRSPFANIVTQWATSPSLKIYSSPIVCV